MKSRHMVTFCCPINIMSKRKCNEVDVFRCSICLDDHCVADKTSVRTCRSHFFCKKSLSEYVRRRVLEADTKIRCPYPNCKAFFRKNEIAKLTTNEDFQKYKRFRKMADNKNYRECSKCHSGTTSGSADMPDITCENCFNTYCFIHGDSHTNYTCENYLHEQNDLKSIDTIQRTTRPCPGKTCGYRIEKNGGCTSVKCRCGQVCHFQYFSIL